MSKVIRLKEDVIIPKGTILNSIDGMLKKYVAGNYGVDIANTNDSIITFTASKDSIPEDGRFEIIETQEIKSSDIGAVEDIL